MSKNVILQFPVPRVPMEKASSRSEKRRSSSISEFLSERGVEERTNRGICAASAAMWLLYGSVVADRGDKALFSRQSFS